MTVAEKTKLKSENIKPSIGARVLNNREELLQGDLGPAIMELIEERGVLVFPEINLSDEEQVVFTKTLGAFAREKGGDDIYKVSLDKGENASAEYLKGAFFWHFDGFTSDMPIRASILSGRVLSPPGTGRTEFANTYAAYEALSDEDKEMLEGKRAVHALAATQLDVTPEPSYKQWRGWRKAGGKDLPLVWTHRSGRKSLVIGNSAHGIIGMDPLESEDLLIRLRDFATGDQFTYSHEWKVGDMVMWDNTGTLHRATDYPIDCGRMMSRTKLEGDEEIA
jgi:alpha-ketoglutarate-dependent taurine dioxygenase